MVAFPYFRSVESMTGHAAGSNGRLTSVCVSTRNSANSVRTAARSRNVDERKWTRVAVRDECQSAWLGNPQQARIARAHDRDSAVMVGDESLMEVRGDIMGEAELSHRAAGLSSRLVAGSSERADIEHRTTISVRGGLRSLRTYQPRAPSRTGWSHVGRNDLTAVWESTAHAARSARVSSYTCTIHILWKNLLTKRDTHRRRQMSSTPCPCGVPLMPVRSAVVLRRLLCNGPMANGDHNGVPRGRYT